MLLQADKNLVIETRLVNIQYKSLKYPSYGEDRTLIFGIKNKNVYI